MNSMLRNIRRSMSACTHVRRMSGPGEPRYATLTKRRFPVSIAVHCILSTCQSSLPSPTFQPNQPDSGPGRRPLSTCAGGFVFYHPSRNHRHAGRRRYGSTQPRHRGPCRSQRVAARVEVGISDKPVRADVTVHGLAGDWSIFRRENVFCEKSVSRKHGPVPFDAARGTVPFSRQRRELAAQRPPCRENWDSPL